MDIITNLLVVFIPCILIYIVFQFNLFEKILNKLDQKLNKMIVENRNVNNVTESENNNYQDKKPSFGNFVFAWLFPLTLCSGYQYSFNSEVFTLVAFFTYAIVLAVFAGIGHYINVRKYLKTINSTVEE